MQLDVRATLFVEWGHPPVLAEETILSADELGEYIEDTARGVKGFFVPEKYEKKQIDIDSSTDAFKDKAKAKEMLKKGDKLPLVFQSKRDKYVADVQKGLKADAASVVTQASVRHTAPEAKAGCMGCGAGAPTETETYTVTVSGKDAQGFKIIYKVSIGASNGKVPGKAN